MADDDTGYGKPPKATRYKPGISGNPKGRPRRDKSVGKIVNDVLDESVPYSENGRKRTATMRELAVKKLIEQAIQGDAGAADILIRMRVRALRRSGTVSKQLVIHDWLPDHPGQTAAQKNQVLESGSGGQVVAAKAVTSPPPPKADGDLHPGVTEADDEAAE